FESKGVRIRGDETIEARKLRRPTGPQIGKQNPAALDHRIGLLPDIAAQVAIGRLGRRLQALTLDVEQPTMERAAKAAMFEAPVGKVGTPMRTGAAEESKTSLIVAEDHKLFAKKLDRLNRPVTAQLVEQCRRLPITPQHLSNWLIGANAGDALILFRAEHGSLQSPLRLNFRLGYDR